MTTDEGRRCKKQIERARTPSTTGGTFHQPRQTFMCGARIVEGRCRQGFDYEPEGAEFPWLPVWSEAPARRCDEGAEHWYHTDRSKAAAPVHHDYDGYECESGHPQEAK